MLALFMTCSKCFSLRTHLFAFVPASKHLKNGLHGSDEGHEWQESHEVNEGDEEGDEEGQGDEEGDAEGPGPQPPLGQTPRLRRQARQDQRAALEERPHQEQERQDRVSNGLGAGRKTALDIGLFQSLR